LSQFPRPNRYTRGVLETSQGGHPMERDARPSSSAPEFADEGLDRDTPDTRADSESLFFSPHFFRDDSILGQNDPAPEALMNKQGRSTLSPDGTS